MPLLTCLFFSKPLFFANMKSQITSTHEVAHQVQIFSVLECIVHIDQEPSDYVLFL